MEAFKHQETGVWTVAITISMIAEVETRLGVNLGLPDWGTPPLWLRLIDDPVLASRILWVCCQQSAKTHGIPEDQFYEDILVGKAFQDAHVALLKAYRDFFQARSIGGAGPRLAANLTKFLDLINSGSSSGSLPGTSASTPASTP